MWQVTLVLLVAAVLTAIYGRYQAYVHNAGQQMRDNFGAWPLLVRQSNADSLFICYSRLLFVWGQWYPSSGESLCS